MPTKDLEWEVVFTHKRELYIREGDIKNPYIDNVLQYSERKDKRVRDNPSRDYYSKLSKATMYSVEINLV